MALVAFDKVYLHLTVFVQQMREKEKDREEREETGRSDLTV